MSTGIPATPGAPAQPPGSVVRALVDFARLLQREGFAVTHVRLLDCLRSMRLLDIGRPDQVRKALSANLVNSREAAVRFDALFDVFWMGLRGPAEEEGESPHGVEDAQASAVRTWMGGDDGEGGERVPVGAGLERVSATADFEKLSPGEVAEAERWILRLARRVALRMSRRQRRAEKPGRLDFRRSMRRSVSLGGELLRPCYRARRRSELTIYSLVDISGSMALYGRFFLLFLYGLQKVWGATRSFVFSTHLTPVTGMLKAAGFRGAMAKILQPAANWKGGTDIGASLLQFHAGHLRARPASRAVVLIVSDGWNRGDSEDMAAGMRLVAGHCRCLIWLNPLMASPRFEPVCQGMRQALPHVDALLPFYSLESLERLVGSLEKLARP